MNATDFNASIILSNQQLFWYANYSNNITGRAEENSTFRWFVNNTNQSGIGNRTAELVPMIYRGAVAYWHLDENGGTSGYADSSGKGNTGTPNGSASNITGIIRGGVSFDGDGSGSNGKNYIKIPDSNSLDLTNNLTITAWVKPAKYMLNGAILTKASWAYYTEVSTNGKFQVYLTGTTNPGYHETKQNITLGAWSYVAWTYDGANVRLYVNGELDNTSATTGSITVTTGAAWIGGLNGVGCNCQFNGSIDEVAVYNHSLTPSEIKQIYLRTWYDYSPQLFLLHPDNATSFNTSDNEAPTTIGGAIPQPGKYVDNLTVDDNTKAYWRFDAGGSTTTANDTSNFGNDGTLVGGTRWVNDSVGGFALQFDGGDGNYVNVPNSPAFDFGTGNYSFEVWIKSPVTTGDKYIWSIDVDGAGQMGMTVQSNEIHMFHGNSSGGDDRLNVAFSETNQWVHLAMVKNGTVVRGYKNGVEHDSLSPITSPINTSGSLYIGVYNELNPGTNFNGTIDEVRILNRSLTAAEVLSDYRAGAKGLGLLSNDYVNYSATGNFNEREGTVEFWVKPEWNGNEARDRTIFESGSRSNEFDFFKTTSGELRLYILNPEGYIFYYGISNWLSGNWHHLAVTWNNYTSNMTLHVDGSQVNNSGTAFSLNLGSSFTLGGPDYSQFCNCTFSEFRISRKALTAQEINHSFSKGRAYYPNEYLLNRSNYAKGDALRLEYLPADSSNATGNKTNSSTIYVQNVASTIPAINTPTANSYNTTSTITWAASTDFDEDTITYRVYVNGTFNGSTTATSLTLNMTTERTYAVNVSAFDGTDDSGNSSTIQFVFDNLAPRIDNGSNSDNTTKFVNRNWTFINFTFTESFNATALILNTSGSTTTNTTPTMSSTYFYANFTNLTDGSYLFRGWMNDSAANVNQTSNFTITIDTTLPNITLSLPSNDGEASASFTLSYFVNDTSGISSCSIVSEVLGTINNGTALNVSNNIANNHYNETNLVSGDQVVWRVDCTDAAGNVKSSANRAFTITQTLPSGADDGGGGVISIGEQSPEPCKEGQQTYYVNSTRYCVTCSGKIEVSKNNPYNVTCIQTKQQQVTAQGRQFSQMTRNQKFLVAAAAATFILLFTNILRWKQKVKKKNVR